MPIPLIAILALAPDPSIQARPVPPGPPPARPDAERCTPPTTARATTIAPSLKLGDQPPASRLYALYTLVDGCAAPIVLAEGIGGNPDRRIPVSRAPARPRPAR